MSSGIELRTTEFLLISDFGVTWGAAHSQVFYEIGELT